MKSNSKIKTLIQLGIQWKLKTLKTYRYNIQSPHSKVTLWIVFGDIWKVLSFQFVSCLCVCQNAIFQATTKIPLWKISLIFKIILQTWHKDKLYPFHVVFVLCVADFHLHCLEYLYLFSFCCAPHHAAVCCPHWARIPLLLVGAVDELFFDVGLSLNFCFPKPSSA